MLVLNYMNIQNTAIDGVKIITPTLFGDERGFFVESYEKARYEEMTGADLSFVQDNISKSKKGVLRGLHFQSEPHAQGKLVSVLAGAVYDVAVDIRKDSPTYMQYVGIELKAPYRDTDGQWVWQQFWVAPGLAHGYLTLEDDTLFAYKCTDTYAPHADGGVIWNDPDVDIKWPEIKDFEGEYIISEKDQIQPRVKDLG